MQLVPLLPGMHVLDENQTTKGGRDGELDDWGQKWGKKGKR
jgi:hypothetical protein